MFLYIFDTMFKLLDTINQKNIAKSNTRILFYFKFHIKLCSFSLQNWCRINRKRSQYSVINKLITYIGCQKSVEELKRII